MSFILDKCWISPVHFGLDPWRGTFLRNGGLVINFTGQVSNGPNKLITIKLIAMEPKMNKGDLNGSGSEPKGSKINPERRQVVLKGIKKEPKGVNNVPKDRASEKGAEIC